MNRTLALLAVFIILFILDCKKETDPDMPQLNLTVETFEVLLNPNGITPLAALARITTNEESWISIELTGEKGFTKSFEPRASNHSIPILGLRAGQDNEVIITINGLLGQQITETVTITTAPLPAHLPEIEILKADLAKMEPGMNLSELNIGGENDFRTQPILFDHTGEIRWFIELDFTGGWTAPFEPLQNGNYLFARGWEVFEYDMLGNKVDSWVIPNGWQHHDAIEKPNGNLIIPISSNDVETWMDHFIEIDRTSGSVVREWDIRNLLDIDRYSLIFNEIDWIHVNSVVFDERDESLIISGRHQGIIKVSKDNELVWILAPHRGWGINGNGEETTDYLLTAVNEAGIPFDAEVQEGIMATEDFDWPWGQHATMLLPNGNIFAFDNGWRRHFQSSTLNGYSRAVEYEIDEENGTVKQVWQYGEERGTETYSGNISDVDFLPETGNRLFAPGNILHANVKQGKIIEVKYPSGEVVFEANINYKNATSTGSGWGAADLIYRSERVPLYK